MNREALPDANDSPVDDYIAQWDLGSVPDVFAFIQQHQLSPVDQRDVVIFDQVRRFQAGLELPAETYLERLPELAHDQSARLDIVYGEFRNHRQHGRPAALPEFLTRFPDLSKELSRQAEFADWVALDDGQSVLLNDDTTIEMPTRQIDGAAVIDVAAPLTMDDFQLEQQLGRGGMGTVYRARQKSLDRPVAIKVLHPDKCTMHHTAAPRFLREGRAIARLKHPHIVGVHGIGRTNEGGYFLVMELVDGQDLRRFAKHGLAIRESVELLATVAEAIAHAHSRGLIHRDLKPANILIDADGRPLVTDFGLARLETDDESDALTQTNDVLGTPSYMAPEQADSRFGQVGPWTDIYGLGAVLYTLLAGRPPVSGNEPLRILSQVISNDPIPSLSATRPDLPARLAEICDRCLRKLPRERFSSAAELARELRNWLEGEEATAPAATKTRSTLGSKRLWQGAAVAIAGLIVATLLLISNPFRNRDVASPQSAASIPESVIWSIEAFRGGNVRDRVSLLRDPGPLFTGDSVRVGVSFSNPTWAYLFWIDSDGEVTTLYPTPGHRAQPQRSLEIPADPSQGLPVLGTPGSEMVVLVMRNSPVEDPAEIGALLKPKAPFPLISPHEVVLDGVAQTGSATDQSLAALERLGAPRRSVGAAETLRDSDVPTTFAEWRSVIPVSVGQVKFVVLSHLNAE